MSTSRPLSVTLGALGGDPRDALVRLSRLGGEGIGGVQFSATQQGLRPRDLDRMARRGLRERLGQLELRATGLDLWIPPGHLSDPQHADRSADAIREAIGLAADLERIGVSLSLPPEPVGGDLNATDGRDAGRINATAPQGRSGIVTAEAFAAFVAGDQSSESLDASDSTRADRARQLIAAMLDEADRRGVHLIDHAVPPRGGDLAGHHRLRVGVDPAAWLSRGADPTMAIARHASRLGAARLCDLTIGGLRAPVADDFAADGIAERQLDVMAFSAALSIAGPGVPLIVDARQWPDPWAGVRQSAEVWRRSQAP